MRWTLAVAVATVVAVALIVGMAVVLIVGLWRDCAVMTFVARLRQFWRFVAQS